MRFPLSLLLHVAISLLPGVSAISQSCGVISQISPATPDSVVSQNTLVYFTQNSTNATSFKWIINGIVSGSGASIGYNVVPGVTVVSLVSINGTCTDTATVVYYNTGNAHDVDSIMVANYGFTDSDQFGTCLDDSPDGGLIMGGYRDFYPCGEDGLVVKTHARGCVDWSREIKASNNCGVVKVTSILASTDSSYYVCAESGADLLIRLDKNGNLLWRNHYTIQSLPYNYIGFSNMTQDDAGNIYSASASFDNGWSVIKINPSGGVIWCKYFTIGPYQQFGNNDYARPRGILWLNGKLFISGNAYPYNGNYFDFVLRLDAATGQRDWQYAYLGGSNGYGFDKVSKYGNDILVAGAASGATVNILDNQGNVIKAISTTFPFSGYIPHSTRAEATTDGKICLMQWNEEILTLQPYFAYYTTIAKFDINLNKYWGVRYSNYYRGYFTDAAMKKNNSFAVVGADFGELDLAYWSGKRFKLMQIDTPVVSSDLNCNYNSTFTLSVSYPSRTGFQLYKDSSLNIDTSDVPFISVSEVYPQSRYLCPDFLDSCSLLKLTGPLSMCSYSQPYTYKIYRNRKCTLIPQWQLPQGASIVSQTDTSITIQFSGFGSYKIGCLINSCIPQKDSLTVTIASKSAVLNLGNDTSLCPNSSITLHASNQFLSYYWQSGSTDSILIANAPGIYWVRVQDSCGNTQVDSVVIKPFSAQVIISPNKVKCNNDTIQLHAQSGFLNYTWIPNYNISSTTSPDVVVNPTSDTAYIVKAEKTPGCFAYDTVRVTVHHSTAINLGGDSTLCIGDSIRLNAGNGFTTYTWNTGATSSYITVHLSGNYSVEATDLNTCKSIDTIKVSFDNLPVFSLGNDTAICQSQTLLLNPSISGNYLWQDGSTATQQTVTQAGLYWLRVSRGSCQYSDSIRIGIDAMPLLHLPSDTILCNQSTLLLDVKQPDTVSSYSWQDGSTQSNYVVKQSGTYIATVTKNSCLTSDTCIVSYQYTPKINLGNDTTKCIEETIKLNAGFPGARYRWQDNSTSSMYTVATAGSYYCTVYDYCGNASDTINVKEQVCECDVAIPNAFSPNGDGVNDYFRPYFNCITNYYHLYIFNRYGAIISDTYDANTLWNGTYQGQKASVGTYFYILEIEGMYSNKRRRFVGNVTLLR